VSRTALVVIDMLNPYEHADADRLVGSVRDTLPNMIALVKRADAEGVPVVYVNDNFGSWRSNQDDLVAAALQGQHPDLVEPIRPGGDALFVVKVRHSIFFQTPLEYLLNQEGIDRLVLVGQVTEQCVLYSALDAHLRHLKVCVPADAVAHIHPDLAEAALRMMELNIGADVCRADKVVLQPEPEVS
jgi:nicotinamidase-related amidase